MGPVEGGEDGGNEDSGPFEGGVDIDKLHSLWVPRQEVEEVEERDDIETELGGAPLGDIHIHRFCDVAPSKQEIKTAYRTVVNAFQRRETDEKEGKEEIRYVDGWMRTGLRFTPLIIAVVTFGLILYGELSGSVNGISALLPNSGSVNGISALLPKEMLGVRLAILGVVGGAVLWILILVLLSRVDLIDVRDFLKAVFVFGLLITLAAGTGYSIYLVAVGQAGRVGSNVIFLSGYLLMLFLCGMLVYDGMLRTEFLFGNYGRWAHGIVTEERIYEDWKDELRNNLNDNIGKKVAGRSIEVSTAHVVAVLFVLQFAVVWYFSRGPQSLGSEGSIGSPLIFLLNIVMDLFVVVVAFKFLILVRQIHHLMADTYELSEGASEGLENDGINFDGKVIKYEPFHVDRHGGFQEFGKFATRVNLILILGGTYTMYRLYVQGFRVVSVSGEFSEIGGIVEQFAWMVSYVGPVVAYALAAAAWLYYSFWAMHRKMVLEKQALFIEDQGYRGDNEQLPQVGDTIKDFEAGPDWYYLSVAPEWPINSRWLASLVSANLAPLLPLLNLSGLIS